MDWVSFEKRAQRYALPAAAAVSLIAAVGLALADRTASATLMAGLFTVAVLFIYFPSLESIKAWGIEAKMIRDTLKDAKASLEQFRKSVALSSSHTYWALSRQGRFAQDDDLSYKNKFAVAVSDLMKETGIDDAAIKSAQAPFLEMIEWDIGGILTSSMHIPVMAMLNQVELREQEIRREKMRGSAIDADEENDLSARRKKLNNLLGLVREASGSLSRAKELLSNDEFRGMLPQGELTVLDRVKAEVEPLLLASISVGYFTREAEAFVNSHSSAEGLSRLIAKVKV